MRRQALHAVCHQSRGLSTFKAGIATVRCHPPPNLGKGPAEACWGERGRRPSRWAQTPPAPTHALPPPPKHRGYPSPRDAIASSGCGWACLLAPSSLPRSLSLLAGPLLLASMPPSAEKPGGDGGGGTATWNYDIMEGEAVRSRGAVVRIHPKGFGNGKVIRPAPWSYIPDQVMVIVSCLVLLTVGSAAAPARQPALPLALTCRGLFCSRASSLARSWAWSWAAPCWPGRPPACSMPASPGSSPGPTAPSWPSPRPSATWC